MKNDVEFCENKKMHQSCEKLQTFSQNKKCKVFFAKMMQNFVKNKMRQFCQKGKFFRKIINAIFTEFFVIFARQINANIRIFYDWKGKKFSQKDEIDIVGNPNNS